MRYDELRDDLMAWGWLFLVLFFITGSWVFVWVSCAVFSGSVWADFNDC